MIKLMCPICGTNLVVCSILVDLYEHVIANHIPRGRGAQNFGNYQCWCGKEFGYWTALQGHLKASGGPGVHYLECKLKEAIDG